MEHMEFSTDRTGLIERHYNELRRFIESRISHRDDAEEMTQELFLRFTACGTAIQPGRERGWLYRVARNLIIDHYRRKREFIPLPDDLQDNPFDSGTRTFASHEARERMERCLKNIALELPETYRSALFSGLLSEATRKDYALLYGLSKSGASSRFTRARETVRKRALECCHVRYDASGAPFEMETRDPSATAC